jgi:hypothetical protein
MFAANVFTIIDSQDMQERHRLGPVAVTPGSAVQGTRPEDRSSVSPARRLHVAPGRLEDVATAALAAAGCRAVPGGRTGLTGHRALSRATPGGRGGLARES